MGKKKSKINIFNVMSPEELIEAFKSNDYDIRQYERIVAMSLIDYGLPHNDIAEILHVSYSSIYRWAKSCESGGLEGLMPNFNGGRKSKFTDDQREKFIERIKEEDNVTITGARRILYEEFGHEYSLVHVSELLSKLGFHYNKSVTVKNCHDRI